MRRIVHERLQRMLEQSRTEGGLFAALDRLIFPVGHEGSGVRFVTLASDYDGTLADHGRLQESTISALKRLKSTGRKVILVTGRELEDLKQVCGAMDLFDRVVLENGALLYRPATREQELLAPPVNSEFVRELEKRGVAPISQGKGIVATWEPHEKTVLEVIRELGIELQVIFNKGAVMVLPTGINKQTGLVRALDDLGLSAHNTVGVGDAENDHAFLKGCECAVAVANALPSIKQTADWVTEKDHGAGVEELIALIIESDLRQLRSPLSRHDIVLGNTPDGSPFQISPYESRILVAGPSGSGKTTAATSIIEKLLERQYQVCLIDPEGDYEGFPGLVGLGTSDHAPSAAEVLDLLEKPQISAAVNLLGHPLEDRPEFFQTLLPRLLEMRAKTGRPHWIVLDEAHHMFPKSWQPAADTLPTALSGLLLVTVHVDSLSPAIVQTINTVLSVGKSPAKTLQPFLVESESIEGPKTIEPDQVRVWSRAIPRRTVTVSLIPSRSTHRRHRRKYALGDVREKAFYFKGPNGRLNLKAQNLSTFLQLADGVDPETWNYHLTKGEYSRWFREAIKDNDLADATERVEKSGLDPSEARERVHHLIEERYTLSE